MSTLIRIKAPTSSNVRSTHSPPEALEFTLIGSKLNSPIGCKTCAASFIPTSPKQIGCHLDTKDAGRPVGPSNPQANCLSAIEF
jgi:hypothetical protein